MTPKPCELGKQQIPYCKYNVKASHKLPNLTVQALTEVLLRQTKHCLGQPECLAASHFVMTQILPNIDHTSQLQRKQTTQ